MTDPIAGTSPASPEWDAALDVTVAWLAKLGDETLDSVALAGATLEQGGVPALELALRDAGLEAWAEDLSEWAARFRSGVGARLLPRTRIDEVLIAACADSVTVGVESPIERIGAVLALVGGDRDPVDDLVGRLRSNPGETLPDALAAWLRSDRIGRWNQRAMALEERLRPHIPTTRDVWTGWLEGMVPDDWACRAVARLWPQRFMDLMDALPAHLAHAAVREADPLSPEDLGALVAAAGPAFEADGTLRGTVTLFAVFEAAERMLLTLPPDDLKTAAGPILTALAERTDGGWCARAWLQRSIWLARTLVRRARPDRPVDMGTIATLGEGLASVCSPLDDPFPWISAEEELWRVYRVLAEALILHVHDGAEAAADLLARAILDGLVAVTGRAEAVTVDALERRIVFNVLGGVPNLVGWLERLWQDCYDIRERIQFGPHHSRENPAIPILAWGLQRLHGRHDDPTAHAALGRWLLNALVETRITHPTAQFYDSELEQLTTLTGLYLAALSGLGFLPSDLVLVWLEEVFSVWPGFAKTLSKALTPDGEATLLDAARSLGAPRVREALRRAIEEAEERRSSPRLLEVDQVERLNAFLALI